jgi:hypothetical protein
VEETEDNFVENPPRGSASPNGLNLLAAITDIFQLVCWVQAPDPSLVCPFRIFLLYLFFKLFTLIKLNSGSWQNPVPEGIL